MKKLRNILLILFLVSTSFLWGQDLHQALNGQIDIVVAQDGSGNFTTIIAAINSVMFFKTAR